MVLCIHSVIFSLFIVVKNGEIETLVSSVKSMYKTVF